MAINSLESGLLDYRPLSKLLVFSNTPFPAALVGLHRFTNCTSSESSEQEVAYLPHSELGSAEPCQSKAKSMLTSPQNSTPSPLQAFPSSARSDDAEGTAFSLSSTFSLLHWHNFFYSITKYKYVTTPISSKDLVQAQKFSIHCVTFIFHFYNKTRVQLEQHLIQI